MDYNTLRQKAIEKLGGKCSGCGESNPLVLEIDHKDNDGKWDRQVRSVFQILKDVTNGIGLDSFQLLCANCHRVKHLLSKPLSNAQIAPRDIHIGLAWRGKRGPKPKKPRSNKKYEEKEAAARRDVEQALGISLNDVIVN